MLCGRERSRPIFVLLRCCAFTLPSLKMHPLLLVWITGQQTHYFVSIFLEQAETSHRVSSREANWHPTWLSYQLRARAENRAWSVAHNCAWLQVPPSLHLPKNSWASSGDIEKEQCRNPALSVCIGSLHLFLPISLSLCKVLKSSTL